MGVDPGFGIPLNLRACHLIEVGIRGHHFVNNKVPLHCKVQTLGDAILNGKHSLKNGAFFVNYLVNSRCVLYQG